MSHSPDNYDFNYCQIGTWGHACMGFSCLKVVLLLFLLLAAIVSSSFALEFITGLFLGLTIFPICLVELCSLKFYVTSF